MASPLYLLGPPLLVLISVPLAIFAVITTSIAVSMLAVRVSIVYFELGVALIHSALFPPPQKPPLTHPSPRRASPHRARNRRSSIASTTSSQDTAVPPRLKNKSGSFVSLIGTSEPTRDFEGVGGWRVAANEDEEALWMGMNSRLELPAALPKRNHRRSLTAGSQRHSWDPEAMRMSPMQSRSRTPPKTATDERHGDSSYFPPQPNMRPLSMQDGRRKSLGGSSSSSLASISRRASLAMKQAGE
ncbi:hypothetical protein P154DRAFT_536848 [Amniculicola lignicola CBS 123094]|uniref:Uncharacterized protein n=1 Tax=Amniculicola lignicola CBS 123094 TaxID=1392246 RepID=A0A6A5WF52_9PLEO|nr:hypothetical protein P154DRAFT_536848 [Amniculicola lignicola CBS 123094]